MILQSIAAVRRLWYVLLLGGLATAGLMALVMAAEPVYWTRSEVVFSLPGVTDENALVSQPDDSLAPLAAAVEVVVNEGRPITRLASREASLYGLGVREGVSVYALNAGNQWRPVLSSPILVVETVSPSLDAALASHQDARNRVAAAGDLLQAQAGVPSADRANAVAVLTTPTVQRYASTRRGQLMAVVASAVVGGLGTMGAIVLIDRRRRCRALVPVRRTAQAPLRLEPGSGVS